MNLNKFLLLIQFFSNAMIVNNDLKIICFLLLKNKRINILYLDKD